MLRVIHGVTFLLGKEVIARVQRRLFHDAVGPILQLIRRQRRSRRCRMMLGVVVVFVMEIILTVIVAILRFAQVQQQIVAVLSHMHLLLITVDPEFLSTPYTW